MSGEKRAGAGSSKSASAFRTISEASKHLDVPQHVLRFWETKFTQVKPMKRAGGRRYYRPEDILLLEGIRDLLYDQGYTIKGVQRLFRDGRVKGGAKAKSPPPRESSAEAPSAAAETPKASAPAVAEKPVEELRGLLQDLTEARDLLRRAGEEN